MWSQQFPRHHFSDVDDVDVSGRLEDDEAIRRQQLMDQGGVGVLDLNGKCSERSITHFTEIHFHQKWLRRKFSKTHTLLMLRLFTIER